MTLTLFYAAGASSLAPHILLEERHLDYRLAKVNLDDKTWAQGNYNVLNPKSYVPALQMGNQPLMTECAVILEFLDNQSLDDSRPRYDTPDYWALRTLLNYIATELHKNFISPFRQGNWLPNTPASKDLVWSRVAPRLAWIDQQLATTGPYLLGERFSIADAYLFVMTNWMHRLAFPFDNLPHLHQFDALMRDRPAVKRVLKQEGRPHALTDTPTP